MLIGMRTQLAVSLFTAFGFALASAETYRSVLLDKIKIEGPKEEVAAALEQEVDTYQLRLMGARIDGESYLAMEDPEVGELRQGLMFIVFKGDAKLPISGAIDLVQDYSGDEVKTYRFTIPEGSAKEIKEEEFLKARQAWAEVRTIFQLPGRPWFNHQSNHEDGLDEVDEEVLEYEMMQTYDIFSGGRAIADNLALNRDLILALDKEEEKVRIDTIDGVKVKAIDWSKHLPKGEVAIDPLAFSIPEDQHALFAPSLHGLLDLMGRVDAETVPLAGMASSESSYRGLLKRYRQQLGLDLSDAAARLALLKFFEALGHGDPLSVQGRKKLRNILFS